VFWTLESEAVPAVPPATKMSFETSTLETAEEFAVSVNRDHALLMTTFLPTIVPPTQGNAPPRRATSSTLARPVPEKTPTKESVLSTIVAPSNDVAVKSTRLSWDWPLPAAQAALN
jgi:hypothetical protein